jgi:peptide/nickel transport system substrate-binding protein
VLAGSLACGRRLLHAPESLGIAVPYEVETLDPHVRDQLGAVAITAHFYEPLVTTDANMQIQPCLARRWENPDPLTWVFHLQNGVTFHSGKPFQAEDVVFTLERLLKNPDLGISAYAQYIAEASAVDPLTVRLRMTRPLSVLLSKLRFIAIIPRGVTPLALREHPDGTGPYRLAGWRKGEALRMVRNEKYWGKKPDFRAVTMHLDRSPEAAVQELLAGQSQLIRCNSKNLQAMVERSPQFRVLRRTSIFIMYLSYDLARGITPYADARPNPFQKKAVRQAINMAIDRKRLIARLTRDAIPATQLVPPFIFGFNPKIAPPVYDPVKARGLLREAGLPNGFEVKLDARKTMSDAAKDVRDQLAQAGIRVTVNALGTREFYDRARRHDLSFYLTAYACPTGDVSDLLNDSIHTPNETSRLGLSNYMGYASPEIDQAIEESAMIQPVDERRILLQKIMSTLVEELVWIPLYVDEDVYAIDRSLSWEPRSDSFVLAAEVSKRTK